MRVLVQRVSEAAVHVDDRCVGRIGPGLLLLVGIGREDESPPIERMARKIVELRIFNDPMGKFNRSLLDVGGQVLIVSQFTLHADARRGRRPSFIQAAPPDIAAARINELVQAIRAAGVRHVAEGSFGASMRVSLINEGPVTLWLDSAELFASDTPRT
ncbi:MAG: D-tyrosyl-tRNA(Tyr) deacylase [Phycisphaeraceae bacterium]|nr:D-tyrosyl-tRNA(Tyr) deacylase [Phycisphaeraceae bacterium]